MEHSCDRCGAPVDESSPFCPKCDSPQVRFAESEASPQKVTVAARVTPLSIPVEIASAPIPTRLNRNNALRAALASGVVAALLSLLPLGLLPAAPIGGFLCVLFYRRRTLTGEPSRGSGFRLGLLGGLCGFVIWALLLSGDIALTHGENQVRAGIIEAVHRQQARNPDPQARQMLDYFLTPRGLAVMMVFGTVFAAIIFVLLAGLGGIVAVTLLRRKDGAG